MKDPPTEISGNRPVPVALATLAGLLLLSLWSVGIVRSGRAPEGDSAHARYLPLLPHKTVVELSLLTDDIWLPVSITGFGEDRFLVTTGPGVIRVISGTSVLPAPFLDLTAEVAGGIESGVYDVALDPDFAVNRYVYVSYLRNLDTSIVARFQVSATDPHVADPTSRVEILTVDQPGPQHNGGALAFGPDGYLYISVGDGRCCSDLMNHGQDLGVLLGKILRIDVSTVPYSIPPDNPYVGVPGARDEIWASGLRNPWRMSFDGLTGDLYVSDVGEQGWEEVNFQPAGAPGGANYGWRCYEGPDPFNTEGCDAAEAYHFPILSYSHNEGCAITGGEVYRGHASPALAGVYLYADYCERVIWLAFPQDDGTWTSVKTGPFRLNPTGFGTDGDGELLVVGWPDYVFRIALEPLP